MSCMYCHIPQCQMRKAYSETGIDRSLLKGGEQTIVMYKYFAGNLKTWNPHLFRQMIQM